MRPLELRLRDFKSYRGKDAVFDFRGRRLVGIVGPIGSGKSSLLDGISFALYGRVPGIKGTTALIHQRAAGAAVSLRFAAAGNVWEVTRAIRRKGQGQHVLVRLSADDDSEPIEKITLKTNVDAEIVRILGLDFEAFTKSVMLAQGRFAEFLQAVPAERDKVLKGVFGHDRIDSMRQAAKDAAATARLEIERLSLRLEEADRQSVRLEENRKLLVTLEERLEQLRKIQPRIVVLEAAIDASDASIRRFAERVSELDALASRLPDAADTSLVLESASKVNANRQALEQAVATAEEELEATSTPGSSLDDERHMLESATALLGNHAAATAALAEADRTVASVVQRTDSVRRQLEVETSAQRDALAEATVADKALLDATDQADVADKLLHAARHAEMALSIAADLAVGDDCPVCERTIDRLPKRSGSIDLEVAQEEAKRAAAALSGARATASSSKANVAAKDEGQSRLAAQLEQIRSDHDLAVAKREDATATVEARLAELRQLLGEDDAVAAVERRRAQLVQKIATERTARDKLDQARRNLAASKEESDEVAKQLDGLRLRIVELSTRLGTELEPWSADPVGVRAALDQVRSNWTEQRAAVRTQADEAASGRDTANVALRELLVEHNVDRGFSDEMSRTAAEAAVLHRDIEEATARLEAVSELRAERTVLEKRAGAFERVTADLTDSRFVRYLLDDERARLAELGSEHFSLLSGGRYRFSADGAFQIVDLTAADAVRAADSLSGGETFLASLGLALALAEMVAREGSRLESFFLDEGFGSLDPEHLDLAMEGIETLVSSSDSRFVAVVSHVPEMRQRVEDLIRLDRDAVTGDTRIIRA